MRRSKIVEISKDKTWSNFSRYEYDVDYYSLLYLIEENCIWITKSLSRI